MNIKLFISAITKFCLGILLVAALVFLPAGTLSFENGLIFMAVLFIPMFFAGIVMMLKNPELLKSRLNAKEKQKDQDIVIKLSGLMFIAGFVISGLNYRFSWYMLPKAVTYIGTVLFLIAYALYAEVLRENAYLSRTIEVREGQKVISTGLYGVVRHPMYSVTLLLFISIPLILGSIYALIVFLAYPFIIAKRIQGEERFLEENLDGYKEYEQKVRYRLIPFIW